MLNRDEYITRAIWGKYTHWIDFADSAVAITYDNPNTGETSADATARYGSEISYLPDRHVEVIPGVLGANYGRPGSALHSAVGTTHADRAEGLFLGGSQGMEMRVDSGYLVPATADGSGVHAVDPTGSWVEVDDVLEPATSPDPSGSPVAAGTCATISGGICAERDSTWLSDEPTGTSTGSAAVDACPGYGTDSGGRITVDFEAAIAAGTVKRGWWYALGMELTAYDTSGAEVLGGTNAQIVWLPHQTSEGAMNDIRLQETKIENAGTTASGASAYRSFLFRIPDVATNDSVAAPGYPVLYIDHQDAGSGVALCVSGLQLRPVDPQLAQVRTDTVEIVAIDGSGTVTPWVEGVDYTLASTEALENTFESYYNRSDWTTTTDRALWRISTTKTIPSGSTVYMTYRAQLHAGLDPEGAEEWKAPWIAQYQVDFYEQDYWDPTIGWSYVGTPVDQLTALDSIASSLSPHYIFTGDSVSETRGFGRNPRLYPGEHGSNYLCRVAAEAACGGYGTGLFSAGKASGFAEVDDFPYDYPSPYQCPEDPTASGATFSCTDATGNANAAAGWPRLLVPFDMLTRFHNGHRHYPEAAGNGTLEDHVVPSDFAFDETHVIPFVWTYGDAPEYLHRALETSSISSTFDVWVGSWYLPENYRHLASVAKGDSRVVGAVATEWHVDPGAVPSELLPLEYQEATGDCLWDTRWGLIEFLPTDGGHDALPTQSAPTDDQVHWRPNWSLALENGGATAYPEISNATAIATGAPPQEFNGTSALREAWFDEDRPDYVRVRLHFSGTDSHPGPDVEFNFDPTSATWTSASTSGVRWWQPAWSVSANTASEYYYAQYTFAFPAGWAASSGTPAWKVRVRNVEDTELLIDGISVYQSIPGVTDLSGNRFPDDATWASCE